MEKEDKEIEEKTSRIASVKWNDIVIGYLIKDQAGYLFKYDQEGITDARDQGYSYLVGFKNLRQIYQSKQLFSVFKSRIPTKQRRDIDKILEDLGLDSYDEFEILLAKKGKTNTDKITVEEELDKKRIERTKQYILSRRSPLHTPRNNVHIKAGDIAGDLSGEFVDNGEQR